jgi:hypothetical protein
MAKIEPIIYAGYSRDKSGKMRFRTATTQKRVFQLEALGEEVYMVIINDVYTKSAAAKELLRINHANGARELEAFYVAQVRDENPFKKTTRVVKVTVPNNAMVHLVGAKVETEELGTAEARKIRNEWNRKHAHLSYDGE